MFKNPKIRPRNQTQKFTGENPINKIIAEKKPLNLETDIQTEKPLTMLALTPITCSHNTRWSRCWHKTRKQRGSSQESHHLTNTSDSQTHKTADSHTTPNTAVSAGGLTAPDLSHTRITETHPHPHPQNTAQAWKSARLSGATQGPQTHTVTWVSAH